MSKDNMPDEVRVGIYGTDEGTNSYCLDDINGEPYIKKSIHDEAVKKAERFTVRYLKEHALRCKIEAEHNEALKEVERKCGEHSLARNQDIQAVIEEYKGMKMFEGIVSKLQDLIKKEGE